MSKQMTVTESVSIPGITPQQRTFTVSADNDAGSEPVGGVGPAATGQLTTRGSASAGTLTMADGHGITTAAVFSLFWAGGSRVGVIAGTVSVDSVPFTGGGGDDLPANLTSITAMVPHVENLTVTGNNAVAALVYSGLSGSDYNGYVTFEQSDGTAIATYELTAALPSNSWDGTAVATNPFAGVTIGKVAFSHGNTTVRTMGADVLFN